LVAQIGPIGDQTALGGKADSVESSTVLDLILVDQVEADFFAFGARARSSAYWALLPVMVAACSFQQDIGLSRRMKPSRCRAAGSRLPTEAALMPTRFWLQQGSAYHFAETAPDFSIKKLFNVVTSGAFVAYQFVKLIFKGFPFAALHITRHLAPLRCPRAESNPFGCTVFRRLRTIQAIYDSSEKRKNRNGKA
jgi:hypothetical protein